MDSAREVVRRQIEEANSESLARALRHVRQQRRLVYVASVVIVNVIEEHHIVGDVGAIRRIILEHCMQEKYIYVEIHFNSKGLHV